MDVRQHNHHTCAMVTEGNKGNEGGLLRSLDDRRPLKAAINCSLTLVLPKTKGRSRNEVRVTERETMGEFNPLSLTATDTVSAWVERSPIGDGRVTVGADAEDVCIV